MNSYKEVVWLASYPKSGNTWLRLFIEAYLLGKVDINNIVSSVADDTSTRYNAGIGEDVRTLPVQVQHLLRPMSLFRLVEMYKQERPVEQFPLLVKTHVANIQVNGFVQLPEQLTKKTVHIVRDPRDVCVSFAHHLNFDIDKTIECMGDKYRTLGTDVNKAKVSSYISSWKMHCDSFEQSDGIDTQTFRYEDMVSKPHETFSKILEHIGLPVFDDKVTEALEIVALDKLAAQEKADGFKESSPKNKNNFFGRGGSHWRDELKPYQVKRIEKMSGHYLEHYGYKGNSNGYSNICRIADVSTRTRSETDRQRL